MFFLQRILAPIGNVEIKMNNQQNVAARRKLFTLNVGQWNKHPVAGRMIEERARAR